MSEEQRITEKDGALVLSKPVISADGTVTVDFFNDRKQEAVDVTFLSGDAVPDRLPAIAAGSSSSSQISSNATYRVSGNTVQPVNGTITIT